MIQAHSFRPPVLFESVVNPGIKYLICDGHYTEIPLSTEYSDIKWERKELKSVQPIKVSGKEWDVIGSKGDKYVVKLSDTHSWSCNCHAYGFWRKCKHITQIKESQNK